MTTHSLSGKTAPEAAAPMRQCHFQCASPRAGRGRMRREKAAPASTERWHRAPDCIVSASRAQLIDDGRVNVQLANNCNMKPNVPQTHRERRRSRGSERSEYRCQGGKENDVDKCDPSVDPRGYLLAA